VHVSDAEDAQLAKALAVSQSMANEESLRRVVVEEELVAALRASKTAGVAQAMANTELAAALEESTPDRASVAAAEPERVALEPDRVAGLLRELGVLEFLPVCREHEMDLGAPH
jgi:hypothetical protein